MKVEFAKAFERDISDLSGPQRKRLSAIVQALIDAPTLLAVPNIKKLKNSQNAYRIRMGDYRIGFFFVDGVVTFIRCLSRKDIYKYFP